MKETVSELKRAVSVGQHDVVLDLASKLWLSDVKASWIAVNAYRSARALDKQPTAAGWVESGLSLFPEDWRFARFRGDALREEGQHEQALNFYERASTLAPEQSAPWACSGLLLMRLKRYEQAKTALENAIRLAPSPHPNWLAQLGMAEMKLGELHQALETTKRALLLKPDPRLEWRIAEIERRIVSGAVSSEATAGFYDDVFANREEYQVHWRESIYAGVWVRIIELLRESGASSILDLGCGPGQFAQAVRDCLPGIAYHGVDFSPVAIERAQATLPEFQFSCATLPKYSYVEFGDFSSVVCTEVLEHVENDLPIMEAIPKGTFTVFSVPNFDSFAHVRIFPSETDIITRYGALFESLKVTAYPMGSGNILWLGVGVRV